MTQATWFVGTVSLALAIAWTAVWFGETVIATHTTNEMVRQAAIVGAGFVLIGAAAMSAFTIDRALRRRRRRGSADT